jgi:hypothetical protein
MENNNPRQIRWNRVSKSDPEEHNYFFLYLLKKREIDRINQRICEQLQPVSDLQIITCGNTSEGLAYKAMSLINYRSVELDWKNIYRGKVVKDRNLYLRVSPDGLQRFIDEMMRK